MGPDRGRTQTDEAHADLVRDMLYVAQVGVHLVASLVNAFQWCAREFQLPARLKRDIRAVFLQPNQVSRFSDRLPIVAITKPFQHRKDRALALVGQWPVCLFAIAEFLVLGADAPIFFRFTAVRQVFGQLLVPFDRTAAALGDGHGLCLARL